MDFDADPLSPPQHSGRTKQDFDLGVKGIQLGRKLWAISNMQEKIAGGPDCTLPQSVNRTIFSWADPAGWIRSNLK